MSSFPARSHDVHATGAALVQRQGHPSTARSRDAALRRVVPLVLALACVPLVRVDGQERRDSTDAIAPPLVRRLTGVVWDARSRAAVIGEVTVRGRAPQRTDSTGRFSFEALASTAIDLRARAIGYRPMALTLAPSSDTATHVELLLEPLTPTLASIATVARREERAQFDERPVTSALSFTRGELGRVPAVGDRDVLRVVALLPGVASRNDFSSAFNVRGGEADQNLVLLDGIPIYNPFHLGGLFGTFIDATVGRVDLLTGGFPASYGGRLSSVLEVTSLDEDRPGIHGTTDLSVLSSSARLAGTANGGRLAWSVAARRTYADKVVEALHGTNDFPYHFRDAQLRVRQLLPGDGTLSFTAYSGLDVLGASDEAERDSTLLDELRDVTFDWGNRVAGITWTQPIGETLTMSHQLSRSAFHTRFELPRDSLAIAQRMGDVRLSTRLVRQGTRHATTFGAEWVALGSRYRELLRPSPDSPFPDALASDGDTTIRQSGRVAALYVDDAWRLSPRLAIRSGVRAEAVEGDGIGRLSPRVTARWFVSPDFALSVTAGRFTQWTQAVRNEDLPLRLFDLWLVSGGDVPVSSATHLVTGAERWLSPSRFVRVEAYHKRFSDLSEPSSTIDPRIRPSLLRRFSGRSYGADVLVRQLERKGLSGWLSYGYSVSMRSRDAVRYFAAHDRRHTANVVAAWSPGGAARWTYGFRAGVATGSPYTGWAGRMTRWRYDPLLHRWLPLDATNDDDIVHGARNGERLPLYARLDASVERRIDVGWGTLHPVLSVVNVLDRRNVLLYALDREGSGGGMRIRRHSQFPILPSLGMRVDF